MKYRQFDCLALTKRTRSYCSNSTRKQPEESALKSSPTGRGYFRVVVRRTRTQNLRVKRTGGLNAVLTRKTLVSAERSKQNP